MTERGRSTEVQEGKARRGIFRSRSRPREKDGNGKTKSSSWKKVVKTIARRANKSSSRTNSVASESQIESEARQATQRTAKGDKANVREVPAAETPSFQLVLLLLEPLTGRFELLQLEFDSERARVIDVLAQVPLSVTEPAIREQDFSGVLCDNGEVMGREKRLVEFCREKQVLVGVPKGLDIDECNRLARPILTDMQVARMLSGSGFDVSKWKELEPGTDSSGRGLPTEEGDIEVAPESNGSGLSGLFFVAFIALLAIVTQTAHKYLEAPIAHGTHLQPGSIRSKCGILGYLPKMDLIECESAFMEVNNDGTVSFYDENRQLTALLAGNTCSTEDCMDGIVFQSNGTILIGGKRVRTIQIYQDKVDISPWPFADAPKLKPKRVRLNK